METQMLSPVAFLVDSLKETHGITLEKAENQFRPNWWIGRLQGYKLELEQQKRGQLRVILTMPSARQQLLCETEAMTDCSVVRKPWGIVLPVQSVEDMADIVDALNEGLTEAELSKVDKVEVRGPSFEGTVFERIQERGATMSGKFGSLVCRAAEMNLEETLAEWTLDNGRQVDGVELDSVSGKPIAIYECQAGIHNGLFLDSPHRDKALGEYLYDPSILPTVRKVVILAGGYSKEDRTIVKERASELARRDQPIEIVLLQTVRIENEISVVVVDFQS